MVTARPLRSPDEYYSKTLEWAKAQPEVTLENGKFIPWDVFREHGYEDLAAETDIELIDLNEAELVELQRAVPGDAPQDTVPVPQPFDQGPVAASPVGGRIKASPLARKMAGQAGLDLSAISGTGPGGRIVKRDVLAAQQVVVSASPDTVVGKVLASIPMQGWCS